MLACSGISGGCGVGGQTASCVGWELAPVEGSTVWSLSCGCGAWMSGSTLLSGRCLDLGTVARSMSPSRFSGELLLSLASLI